MACNANIPHMLSYGNPVVEHLVSTGNHGTGNDLLCVLGSDDAWGIRVWFRSTARYHPKNHDGGQNGDEKELLRKSPSRSGLNRICGGALVSQPFAHSVSVLLFSMSVALFIKNALFLFFRELLVESYVTKTKLFQSGYLKSGLYCNALFERRQCYHNTACGRTRLWVTAICSPVATVGEGLQDAGVVFHHFFFGFPFLSLNSHSLPSWP